VAEYVAAGKDKEENRKKLDYLVKVGKCPISVSILPICYYVDAFPTTVFRKFFINFFFLLIHIFFLRCDKVACRSGAET
jgi:hypothetical protein